LGEEIGEEDFVFEAGGDFLLALGGIGLRIVGEEVVDAVLGGDAAGEEGGAGGGADGGGDEGVTEADAGFGEAVDVSSRASRLRGRRRG
jgi:hypothetical protein